MINKNGLQSAIKAYQDNINSDISKDKIKSDLKNIFTEYNVDASNFLTVSLDSNSGTSITNYIDKLSDAIYKKAQKKNQTTADKTETDEEKAESSKNDNKEEQKQSEPKKITVSDHELLQWSEDEIKPQLTNKMLAAGFTIEEINSPDSSKFTYDGNNGSTKLNITENIPLIDRMVEMFKMLKRALESGKNIEDALREMNNEGMEQDSETPAKEENNQSQPDDNLEQNEESSPNHGDELTAEDLEDILRFGIEGITSHSKMEEFRKSAEWEQLQTLQENAFGRE